MWLAANALAAGLVYEGADFELRPPPAAAAGRARAGRDRHGQARRQDGRLRRTPRGCCASAGRDVVVVAMGRGGPAEPELVDAGRRVRSAWSSCWSARGPASTRRRTSWRTPR